MRLFFRKKEGWILDRQLTVSAIVVFQIHAFISDFLVLFSDFELFEFIYFIAITLVVTRIISTCII